MKNENLYTHLAIGDGEMARIMRYLMLRLLIWSCCLVSGAAQSLSSHVTDIQTQPDGPFLVDSVPTFPIGFTGGPPAGMTTPRGVNGMADLVREGFTFQLWYCPKHAWGPAKEAELDALLREANAHGMHVVISIDDLQHILPSDTEHIAELKRVLTKYHDNPAIFFWKGTDEPQWGKVPVENLRVYYDTVHALDPHHPIWITQAPRGTVEDWKPYSQYFDIGAVDIYPISYPPGTHSGIDNKDISVVGDYALRIRQSTDFRKPTMMVLQICWSGVAKPGKTLRFPTFAEERYMTYQAIIDGARGLVYFGGNVAAGLNERDAAYGWNWNFYDHVLQPVLDELKPDGPLYPALIAPNSRLQVSANGDQAMELTVRESGQYIYLLAARREGATAEVNFSGLPQGLQDGEVLFESPRHVSVVDGKFTDWFGPHEVHVYRFRRQ
jgi:hypothetical protein